MNGGTYLTGLITGIGKTSYSRHSADQKLFCINFTGFSKHHKNQIHFNESKSWAYLWLWGLFIRCIFFQVGGPITAGLISGREAFWRGGGVAYYRMYFFPGRWACKFGAYEWQFMVIYLVVQLIYSFLEQIKLKVFKCSLQSILKKLCKWMQIDKKKQQHCNQ